MLGRDNTLAWRLGQDVLGDDRLVAADHDGCALQLNLDTLPDVRGWNAVSTAGDRHERVFAHLSFETETGNVWSVGLHRHQLIFLLLPEFRGWLSRGPMDAHVGRLIQPELSLPVEVVQASEVSPIEEVAFE